MVEQPALLVDAQGSGFFRQRKQGPGAEDAAGGALPVFQQGLRGQVGVAAHRGVRRDGEDQVVDGGLAGPVVRIGLVADDGVLLVGKQRKRTGADRLQIGLTGDCIEYLAPHLAQHAVDDNLDGIHDLSPLLLGPGLRGQVGPLWFWGQYLAVLEPAWPESLV